MPCFMFDERRRRRRPGRFICSARSSLIRRAAEIQSNSCVVVVVFFVERLVCSGALYESSEQRDALAKGNGGGELLACRRARPMIYSRRGPAAGARSTPSMATNRDAPLNLAKLWRRSGSRPRRRPLEAAETGWRLLTRLETGGRARAWRSSSFLWRRQGGCRIAERTTSELPARCAGETAQKMQVARRLAR
jgi:hypothetical protein